MISFPTKPDGILELYLIRHAESEGNINTGIVGGQSNHLQLTERGILQAKALGEHFLQHNIFFDGIFCSTAERAKATATTFSSYINFPADKIVYSDDLLEISQGEWEGRPRVEVYTPEVLERISSDVANFCPPSGESLRDVEKRMLNFIHHHIHFHPDKKQRYAIVSHGTALRCLIRAVLGFEYAMIFRVVLHNTSVTNLQRTAKGWYLERLNDSQHLNKVGYYYGYY
ncbi:MAG: histidine phosphatase family protein [Cytophagales bacterium]|nr:histidine phosphatase family protein [Cytophagales bacterium]MDW8385001.1 histidine phosphatase family protein [Flammeovirgaceae bacterium]